MWIRHPLQNQEGTQSGATTLAPPGPTTPAAPAAPSAEEIEQLRGSAARLATLEARLAADEKKNKDAQAAAAVDLEKKGELQKALDATKARLAELEPHAGKAAKWDAFEATELKRITEAASKLPEAAQKAIAAAPDIETKLTFLNAFSTGAGVTVHKPASSGGPPANNSVDWSALWGTTGWAEAKARDPKGAEAWLTSKQTGGISSITSISPLLRAPNKTA